jgi:hypothetical protein
LAFHVSKVETEREEPTMQQRNIFGAMALAVWASLAAFILAPMAQADPDSMDRQFLALLDRDGISATSGATTEISVAHSICQSRMSGNSESVIIQFVYEQSHLNLNGATALVRDAEQVYCPGYLGGGGRSA